MRLAGRVFKNGRFWAIEVPMLGVFTQGRTKRDALEMVCDAIELLIDAPRFKARAYPGAGEYFEVGATEQGPLIALLLRRARLKSGLSLAQVAQRLGAKSLNAYARYEQGRAVPTVEKLSQLFSAVMPGGDFVLHESRAA